MSETPTTVTPIMGSDTDPLTSLRRMFTHQRSARGQMSSIVLIQEQNSTFIVSCQY